MRRSGEYPDDWDQRRKRVLKRDNYECQQCDATDTELHVHHTTPISDGGGHELSNLTTICQSGHTVEHPVLVKLFNAISDNKRVKMKYSSSSGTRVRRHMVWKRIREYSILSDTTTIVTIWGFFDRNVSSGWRLKTLHSIRHWTLILTVIYLMKWIVRFRNSLDGLVICLIKSRSWFWVSSAAYAPRIQWRRFNLLTGCQ